MDDDVKKKAAMFETQQNDTDDRIKAELKLFNLAQTKLEDFSKQENIDLSSIPSQLETLFKDAVNDIKKKDKNLAEYDSDRMIGLSTKHQQIIDNSGGKDEHLNAIKDSINTLKKWQRQNEKQLNAQIARNNTKVKREMKLQSEEIGIQTDEDLVKKEDVIEQYDILLANAKQQKQEMELALMHSDARIKALQKTLQNQDIELKNQEELQNFIKNLENKNSVLEKEQNELQQTLSKFEAQEQEEFIKIDELQKLEKLSQDNKKLLEDEKKKNEELRDELEITTSEYHMLLGDKQVELLQSNMAKDRAEIEKQELESRNVILNAKIEVSAQMLQESDISKKQIQTIENEKKELQEERTELINTLQQTRYTISELNAKNQELEAEKSVLESSAESFQNAQLEITDAVFTEKNKKRLDVMMEERGELIDLITQRDKGAANINKTLTDHIYEQNIKLDEHDKNFKTQSGKLEEATESLQKAQQDLIEQTKENEKLTQDLKTKQDQLWQQESDVNQLNKELSELGSKLADKTLEKLNDLAVIRELEKVRDDFSNEIKNFKQEEKEKSQQLNQIKKKTNNLHQQLAKSQQEVKQQKELFENAQQNHNNKIQTLAEGTQKLRADLYGQYRKNEISRDENQKLQHTIQKLESNLASQLSDMEEMKNANNDKIHLIKQEYLNELERQAKLSDARIEFMTQESVTRSNIISEQNVGMHGLIKEFESGKKQIEQKALSEELKNLHNQYDALSHALNISNLKQQNLYNALQDAEQQTLKMQHKLNSNEVSIAERQAKLAKSEATLKQRQAELKNAKQELQQSNKQAIQLLKQNIKNQSTAIENLTRQIKHDKEQIEGAKQRENGLLNIITDNNNKLSVQQQKLQQYEEQFQQLKERSKTELDVKEKELLKTKQQLTDNEKELDEARASKVDDIERIKELENQAIKLTGDYSKQLLEKDEDQLQYIEAINKSNKIYEEQIIRASDMLSERRDKIEQTSIKDQQELNNYIAKLEKEKQEIKDQLQQKHDHDQEKISLLETDLKNKSESLAFVKDSLHDMTEATAKHVYELNQERITHQQALKAQQKQIQTLQKQLQDTQSQVIKTSKNNTKLTYEIGQLESLGIDKDNQVIKLQNELDKQKKELQKIQQNNQQQMAERNDFYSKAMLQNQRDIKSLENMHDQEVKTLQSELAKANDQIKQLEEANTKDVTKQNQEIFVTKQDEKEINNNLRRALDQRARWLNSAKTTHEQTKIEVQKMSKDTHEKEKSQFLLGQKIEDGYKAYSDKDKKAFAKAKSEYNELSQGLHAQSELNFEQEVAKVCVSRQSSKFLEGSLDAEEYKNTVSNTLQEIHKKFGTVDSKDIEVDEESLGIKEMHEQNASKNTQNIYDLPDSSHHEPTVEDYEKASKNTKSSVAPAQDSLVTISKKQGKQLAQDSIITQKSMEEEDEDKLLKAYRNLNKVNNDLIPQDAEQRSAALLDKDFMSKNVSKATTKSYQNITEVIQEVGAETKPLNWGKDPQGKEQLDLGHGFKPLSDVSEKQGFRTGNGVELKNYRAVDVPNEIDAVGETQVLSLVVRDVNGNNISQEKLDKHPELGKVELVYKKDGKLGEIVCPKPVFESDSKDPKAPIYTIIDGEVYTLPINKGQYDELNQSLDKGAQHIDMTLDKTKSIEIEVEAGLPKHVREEAKEIGKKFKKTVSLDREQQQSTVSSPHVTPNAPVKESGKLKID